MIIKLVADAHSGHLLGAQMAGEGVSKRIDVIATARCMRA
jgi:pyruvate/2-oxoglutarate dehydrogenase complex dihydrolipoamide dehydrogenase (E3) component